MNDLGKAEKMIVDLLKKNKQPLSTYEIAKRLGISWSTTNIHCYKLMSKNIIAAKNEEMKLGIKRVMWWLK